MNLEEFNKIHYLLNIHYEISLEFKNIYEVSKKGNHLMVL